MIESCTIITTEANDLVSHLHNLMPAILDPAILDHWLDPRRQSPKDLLPLLQPAGKGVLDLYPVSEYVNEPGNEGAKCMEPVDGE